MGSELQFVSVPIDPDAVPTYVGTGGIIKTPTRIKINHTSVAKGTVRTTVGDVTYAINLEGPKDAVIAYLDRLKGFGLLNGWEAMDAR